MDLLVKKPMSVLLNEAGDGEHSLKRTLGAGALVALGVGAIIGAGLFSLTGIAAANNAGPAVLLSFVLAAFGCAFAGMCYSEFATMIPIAGSAYTYSYATLGEIFAWIIGWDLILEYAVSNVAVAVGFSGYLKAQLAAFGLVIPDAWSSAVWASGKWTGAYFNLPGFLVVFVLTVLLVRGVRE